MTPVTPTALRPATALIGSLAVLAVGAALCVVASSPVTRGFVIGAALGIVNLWLGLALLHRCLRTPKGDIMIVVAIGFGARLVVMLAMLAVVGATAAVSAPAFGFTFLGFVIVYFGIEVLMATRMQEWSVA